MTFDQVLPTLRLIFERHVQQLEDFGPILINRDLNARVRIIVDEKLKSSDDIEQLNHLAQDIFQELGEHHAYPVKYAVLFEPNLLQLLSKESVFLLCSHLPNVYVVERLATPTTWSKIIPISEKKSRVVFFSIKGGVGRSSALSATAWTLAESGKKVMVLDLDLESPGLSSSLLPKDQRPKFGICDWLVEDLTGNGSAVFDDMVASSPLSRNGEVLVVPAHGSDAGEYIAKLGRVWMPTRTQQGETITWSKRLSKLIDDLEDRWEPDVILIDSRAGIDEVASACLTELGASTILLFAINGDQTWSGYRILFKHWRTTGVVQQIRERLQLVGAMLPDVNTDDYFRNLRADAWDLFSDELYDEIPPDIESSTEDGAGIEYWNFNESDDFAPHRPLPIRWHRSFAGLKSLHGRLDEIDASEVEMIFGPMIDYVAAGFDSAEENDE